MGDILIALEGGCQAMSLEKADTMSLSSADPS